VPHVSDQFAWSDELKRLGVAPSPIRRTRLSATVLAARITEVLNDPRMKAAAMAIGARMQSDNGPERAADLIEARYRT
jgi:UDP:flavonoid glycosyltransferase YjiC (YdhE family)